MIRISFHQRIWPGRVSNPVPLTPQTDALPIALLGPACRMFHNYRENQATKYSNAKMKFLDEKEGLR